MIPPAMNPQQWAAREYEDDNNPRISVNDSGAVHVADAWPYEVTGQGRHALAAFCLHEQEFGFTSDEVDRLLRIAAYLDTPEVTASEDGWFLEAFAAKVRALLQEPR